MDKAVKISRAKTLLKVQELRIEKSSALSKSIYQGLNLKKYSPVAGIKP